MLPETFQPSGEWVRLVHFVAKKPNLLDQVVLRSTWLNQHERDSIWISTMAGPLETLVGLYCNKLLLRSAQLVSCVGASAQSSRLWTCPTMMSKFGKHIWSSHCCIAQVNFFHIRQHGDKESKKWQQSVLKYEPLGVCRLLEAPSSNSVACFMIRGENGENGRVSPISSYIWAASGGGGRGNGKTRQGCSSSIFNQIRLFLQSLWSHGV
jgi:hypothetical protein